MSCWLNWMTCFWCHRFVPYDQAEIEAFGPPYCPSCGHLATSRSGCDCDKCSTPCVPAELTEEDLRSINEELRRRRKAGA